MENLTPFNFLHSETILSQFRILADTIASSLPPDSPARYNQTASPEYFETARSMAEICRNQSLGKTDARLFERRYHQALTKFCQLY